MKKRKYVGKLKLLPGGLLFIVAAGLVSAVILGAIHSVYTGSQTGDLTTEGIDAAVLFDSEQVVADTWSIPMDTFTDDKLAAGETETFTHTIELTDSYDAGFYGVLTFDYSAMSDVFTDPNNDHYGYYLDVLDGSDVSIKDSSTYLVPGGGVSTIKIEHELDSTFVDVPDPLAYDLDVVITKTANVAPVAEDVTGELWSWSTTYTYDIADILNFDENPDAIDITAVSLDPSDKGTVSIIGTYPTEQIELTTGSSASDPLTINFTIEDELGLTDDGSVVGVL